MLLVGGDVNAVPRQQLDHPVFTLERGGPGEDHHPLVLGLVKPEAIGRPVPRADDPFDPDASAVLENRGEFLGEIVWEVGEEIPSETPPEPTSVAAGVSAQATTLSEATFSPGQCTVSRSRLSQRELRRLSTIAHRQLRPSP